MRTFSVVQSSFQVADKVLLKLVLSPAPSKTPNAASIFARDDLDVLQPRSVLSTALRMSSTAPDEAIFFLKKSNGATAVGLQTFVLRVCTRVC